MSKNHEIDDPYVVLACFWRPKTSHFHVENPSFFEMFQEPLPEGIFKGPKCPSRGTRSVFESFSEFRGSQKHPLGPHFSPERSLRGRYFLPPVGFWAQPARKHAPQTPPDPIFIDLGPNSVGFCQYFDNIQAYKYTN